jgi:monooxygenase
LSAVVPDIGAKGYAMTEAIHVDVVVVGAGISGIGAGYHLQQECPDRSYVILEGRDSLGGTWDLFRYPGVRADSDMHTLGYSFKPWTDPKSIADGPAILDYLTDTAAENGIDQHMRFNHLVSKAEWCSDAARWTVTAQRSDMDETVTYTCNFLFMCSGYYSYKGGYEPEFPGSERFQGLRIHPQQWPEDLDYQAKRVVVVGSGATAVTLIPAMADDVEHITMLQRSPSYVVARPDEDVVANRLRRVLPERVAYSLTRKKNIVQGELFYNKTRTHPDKVKELILGGVRQALGPDYDVDTHFTPSYNPWDQRMCLVPNGDLFQALNSGKASVVTDTIETFTETGIQLESGEHLDADIIVTATGLQLVTLGEVEFFVDDVQVDFSKTFTYKGLAYSDVPNLVSTFGYINASWTLRADVVCGYVCRVLNHLTETGTDAATPRLRESDRGMAEGPWIDDFSSGYMQRMMHAMPRQGDRAPWINPQRVSKDKKLITKAPIADGVVQFTRARSKVAGIPEATR